MYQTLTFIVKIYLMAPYQMYDQIAPFHMKQKIDSPQEILIHNKCESIFNKSVFGEMNHQVGNTIKGQTHCVEPNYYIQSFEKQRI